MAESIIPCVERNFTFKKITINGISIADGRTTTAFKDIDLSSYIPDGKKLYGVAMSYLGTFQLPYITSIGGTFIETQTQNTIHIRSNVAAWNNVSFYALLVLEPNS